MPGEAGWIVGCSVVCGGSLSGGWLERGLGWGFVGVLEGLFAAGRASHGGLRGFCALCWAGLGCCWLGVEYARDLGSRIS